MAQVCPTPISISLKTTPSICETDGKVDLEHIEYKEDEVIHYSFHSYAIYSDASLSILLRPWQNSSTFTDLAAGTYYYAVRAFCDYSPSAIVSKPFTITNTTPKLSTTLKVKKHSSCGNGTIEATTTGGVLPYQFSLVSDLNSFEPIATDQYLRPKQFSPIFENLPSGAYYVRVYDACNKYTTQRISIDSNRISTVFSGISVALKNCDQFSLNLTPHTYVAQHVDANTRLIINYPNGVIDTVPYAASVELNQNNFNHNETNNKITVTILIDCGSFSTTYTFDPHPRGQFIMNSTYLTRCNYRKYTFTSNSGEPYYYSLDSGLTWIPNTSNLILELENDSSHHVMFAQCGDTSVFKPFQQKYDDFEVKISEGNSRTCNGYSSIKVDFKNTNYLYWEILSGPSTSTKKGTVSTGALSASYTIVNLPLGTYVLKFTDNCENEIIDSITIVNAYDQLVFDYNIRFECSDNNIELYDLPTYTTSFGYRILDSEGKVVISGTLSGKYIINSQKIVEDALYSIEVWPTAYPCSVIEKTFVRPVNYNNLDLTNYVSFPSCQEENNTGSIILQPQGGYPPYVYDLFEDTLLIHKKIIGPTVNNLFENLIPDKKYIIQVSDQCGRGSNMSLNYKELVIEEEEEVEGVFICLGDTLTLSSYDIPGLNYQWKKDNVILENEQNPDFTLWNIDTSDVGIYQISYFLEECRITTKTFDLHPIDCPLIPLNVHLQKWYLTDESQDVALSWFISNEEKVLSYQIFHSSNLQDWNALGIIYPDKRNLTIQNYQYLHRDVPSGYNYYKLKINHQDNTYTWSSIITFFKKAFSQEIVLFPNPSQNWIKISNLTHPCKIKIINSIGEILSEWTTSSEILEMDVQYLNNGFYILIAETPEISSTVNIPFIISK